MWVKGSGSDLATMRATDFTPLRLDEILPLYEREEMSDEEMVAYLRCCQLEPAAPRASIETLLHAFVPADHVHHTHPDAINAIACSRDGESLAAECFGARAAWVPYIRPGFTLAKQVGKLARSGDFELIILAKHGLVVWSDSADDAYDRTMSAIGEAAAFVTSRVPREGRFGGPHTGLRPSAMLNAILPALRGAVSSERPKFLVVDASDAALEFVSSRAAADLVTVGAACPDHLVHTKRIPLWIQCGREDDVNSLADRIRDRAEAYRAEYRKYFDAHGAGEEIGDPDPRVVLIEGLGLVAVGATVKAATLSRDLYHRAIEVMAGAHALGGFVSLTPAESFAVEYWPLELYKLSLAPPRRELEGKVAFVTGAAGGIGRAVVDRLAQSGASVVGFDLDCDGVSIAIAPYGDAGLAVAGDVTSEEAVRAAFRAAVERFGGVDIVVSNAGIASSAPIEETTIEDWNRTQSILVTGYFLVARAAFRLMRDQRTGGSIVFVASKNALVAGKNASAYSTAKAAELHLARCLAEEGGEAGIRVNTVNPDAVLQGSRIWGSRWREERAASYGIHADELEEHYRRRTTLGVRRRRGCASFRLRDPVRQEHWERPQRRRGRGSGLLALMLCGISLSHLPERHGLPGDRHRNRAPSRTVAPPPRVSQAANMLTFVMRPWERRVSTRLRDRQSDSRE